MAASPRAQPDWAEPLWSFSEAVGLPRATAKALAVAVFYGCSSLLLGLMNKALLSSYEFNGYFTLLAVQMTMSWAMCTYSRDCYGNPFKVPAYDPHTHRMGATVGVLYVCNVGAGLIGLQMVNIPMFFCIRRLVTPTVLVYEYLTLGKVAEPSIQAAVACIMLGTIVAGWDTFNSDILGYSITLLNNFLTAAATVAQKQFNEATHAGAFGVLYYNACTAAPLSAALAVLTGELYMLPSFKHFYSLSFWFAFTIACALGPLLTYSSMLCTTYNSPLATSVTGNVKDLAQVREHAAPRPALHHQPPPPRGSPRGSPSRLADHPRRDPLPRFRCHLKNGGRPRPLLHGRGGVQLHQPAEGARGQARRAAG